MNSILAETEFLSQISELQRLKAFTGDWTQDLQFTGLTLCHWAIKALQVRTSHRANARWVCNGRQTTNRRASNIVGAVWSLDSLELRLAWCSPSMGIEPHALRLVEAYSTITTPCAQAHACHTFHLKQTQARSPDSCSPRSRKDLVPEAFHLKG